jgi:lipopolysaccharide export LptBFGC system permease protein LptF
MKKDLRTRYALELLSFVMMFLAASTIFLTNVIAAQFIGLLIGILAIMVFWMAYKH